MLELEWERPFGRPERNRKEELRESDGYNVKNGDSESKYWERLLCSRVQEGTEGIP